MITAAGGVFSGMEQHTPPDSSRIEILRQKISDGEYISEAIQRIAQILSNEISNIPKGTPGERKRQQ
jgi:anti-sigma28 factor (negative regulator of flagellin synthesis)